MMTHSFRWLLATTALAAISPSALAQTGAAPVEAAPAASSAQKKVPPANPEALVDRTSAGAAQSLLMRRHGMSAAEAKEKIALNDDISALARKLFEANDEDFASIWIEYEPVYRVVLAFKGTRDRTQLLGQIDPKLRRYIHIKNVVRSGREIEGATDQIVAALQSSGIDYVSFYDHRTDKLVVEVARDADVPRVRDLVPPAHRAFVRVQKGVLPVRSQVNGVQAGDSIYGGWWYYTNNTTTTHNCSFAFTAKNNVGRQVILTAAHCGPQYWVQQTGHMVQLTGPMAEWPTGKYDYEFHDITGLQSGPYVWYENNKITYPPGYTTYNNNVPGQAASGYFRLVGSRGYYDQVVGQPVCKSGQSTGFTCGTIMHGYYTWHGTKGWIQWGQSDQDIVGYPGDSGGAVFDFDPNPGDIRALGIISGVNVVTLADGTKRPCLKSDTFDCYVIHMPIDYIDDQQLLTLVTASQT
jgi:streptogrisin D